MSAVLLLLLVGFSAAMAVQTAQIRQQATQLAVERDQAEAATAFLERIFTASDPGVARGDSVTARQLLDDGAARIETDLDGQPEVQARLWGTVGRVYTSLGLHGDAVAPYAHAVDRLRQLYPQGHPRLVPALVALGQAAQNAPQADADTAIALHEEAVALARRHLTPPHSDFAHALFALGSSLSLAGRGPEAQPLFEQARVQFEALPAADDAGYAYVLVSLGNYAFAAGDAEEAEALFRRALAIRRQLHGDAHPDVISALQLQGSALSMLGRREEALAGQEEALALAHEIYAPDSDVFGMHYYKLGLLYYELERYAEAVAAYGESLRIGDLHHARPYYLTAITRFRLAQAHHRAGAPAAALDAYDAALPELTALFGSASEWALNARLGQGVALRDLGRLSEATRVLEGLLPTLREALSTDQPAYGASLVELGDAYVEQGRYDEAIPLLREGYALYQTHFNDQPPRVARAEYALGVALAHADTPDEASPMLTRALAYLRAHPDTRSAERVATAEAALLRTQR
jgi:serine/threonine-protein kinase